MKVKNSMRSAFLFLILGFVLSSITINIGFIGEIEGYLSVWCYLLGLYLLRKDHRLFSICFMIQIYLTMIFIISKTFLYITPIEMPMMLAWSGFIIKSIQNLLIIYAIHLYAPSMNLYLTMILECILIGIIWFVQDMSMDWTLIFLVLSFICMIIYQLQKSLSDVENNEMKVSLQNIPIVKMLVLFFGSGLVIGVITLYAWPYTAYQYNGEMEPFTTDAKELDSIQLSNGWQGHIYEYNENENLYVFHYQGKLSQKYSMIDVDFTHNNSLSREFYMSHVTFGNGKQRYDYRDRYQDNMLFLGYSQPIYRVYLNPDDENIDITVQFIRQYHEDDTLKEFVFNLTYYEYGKVYSEGSGHSQQTIFRSQNEKWDTQEI